MAIYLHHFQVIIHSKKKQYCQHVLLPEEGFSRNRTDEPLKQFACSLPAVVDSSQVWQQSI